MPVSQKRLTLEEFLNLPEKKPALEFDDGGVTQKVSPRAKHSTVQYVVCELFNRFAEPRKLAFAFPELRTTFGGRSYVPDVAIYRRERIPLDDRGRPVDDFFIPPDIAVEILSPGQRASALKRKCLWYVANGVSVALLVDPEDEPILAFRPDQQPQALRGDDTLELGDLLPGFNLRAREVFDSLKLG